MFIGNAHEVHHIVAVKPGGNRKLVIFQSLVRVVRHETRATQMKVELSPAFQQKTFSVVRFRLLILSPAHAKFAEIQIGIRRHGDKP